MTEKELIEDFALGQKCPNCNFTGFDHHGRAFYGAETIHWQVGCQNCGHSILVGYKDSSRTEIVVHHRTHYWTRPCPISGV
jgi:DNA-directed RNA polymerase subunit RPC12/RpoP